MNYEIKRLTSLLKNTITQVPNPPLQVINSFPIKNRPVPLKKAMATLTVSQATISGLSIGEFSSSNLAAKKLDISWKLTILSPMDAENSWELFEFVASRLAFSSEIHASKIECTEPNFSKDLGGIVIIAKIYSSFTIANDNNSTNPSFKDVLVSANLS